DLLAAAPVAEKMPGGGIADARGLPGFDFSGDVLRRIVAVARAQRLHLVLPLHPGGENPVALGEGFAEHLLGALPLLLVRARAARASGERRKGEDRRGPHRFSPGAWISPPFAYFAMNTSSAIDASEV